MSIMKRSFAGALGLGFAGGCLGGAIAGAAEGWWVLAHSSGSETIGVVAYAVLIYALGGAAAGLALGAAVEVAVRVMRRDMSDGRLYALASSVVIVLFSLVVWRFLIRRDVFQEQVSWTSPLGLGLQAGMALLGIFIVFIFWKFVGRAMEVVAKRFFLKAWVAPLVVLVICAAMFARALMGGKSGAEAGDPAEGGKGPKGPNVLLIMVDTLRADCCDPYGAGGLTPNLASFAGESVTFKRAYAQASWTRPSVATVLSGRYPSSHKAIFKMDQLPDAVETVGEALRDEGYLTAAMVTNYVTSPYFGFGQGFDSYHYLEPTYFMGASDASSKLLLYEIMKKMWSKFVAKGSKPGAHYQDGKVLTDAAIEWFEGWNEKAGEKDRFFFYLQYMDPHDPYFAHPDDGKAVARKAVPEPPQDWAGRMKDLYTGEVKFWDKHFGRLLSYLKRQKWWDETLVVFFSDHGEEFLEHGGWWHGDTLFEEQIHVPLIVKLPKGEAGGTVIDGGLVGLVDVAPTICRLAGAIIPGGFEGQDLFDERSEPVFAEEDHVGNSLRSIIYKKGDAFWKIIAANEGNPRGVPEKSLFNLSDDREEKKNLAGKEEGEYKKAAAKLKEIEKQIAGGAVKRKTIELDKTATDHLKDLGYIRD